MKPFRLRIPLKFSRFARDRRGVSAVEFALVAPLLVALYLGCVEISDGVSADRKVTLTAAALANLSAQVTTITTADMTNILDASSAIIAPYSPNNRVLPEHRQQQECDGEMERRPQRHRTRGRIVIYI